MIFDEENHGVFFGALRVSIFVTARAAMEPAKVTAPVAASATGPGD